MRYFPDDSFDDSSQEPLKELDFNESTGSYAPLSTSKRAFKNEPELFSKRQDRLSQERRTDNKENRVTDSDKLPVYHRGPHGEQLGTLIVRHHAQKDSKCIQCRNCGIFFTVASFLKHCHDQYGKRIQCNGVHLQLGLDRPTSQQREAWGTFQKKMLSDAKEHISDNCDPPRVRNGRLSEQNLLRSKAMEKPTQRLRRSSVDLALKRPLTQVASSFKYDDSLLRSKESLSSSGLRGSSHPNSLSLSQLNIAGTYSAQRNQELSREKKNTQDWMRNTDNPTNRVASWSKSDTINASSSLATSLNRRNASDATNNFIRDTNTNLWDVPTRETTNAVTDLVRDSTTRPWDVPDMINNDSFPRTKIVKPSSIEDSIDLPRRPSSPRAHGCDRVDAYETSAIDAIPNEKCTEDLVKSAITMLEKASLKIKSDNGNNSNAWRKMYEEERDHRMKLEAKVRDLERELRLKS